MPSYSIVEYVGESNDGKCGYCKKTGNYNSTGFWAHSLCVSDYQDLINRNWRRSGQYCYVPKNKDTCCPMYTIKCDAMNFKLNNSHKKIVKRINKFLRDGIKDKNNGLQQHDDSGLSESQEPKPSKERSDLEINCINVSSLQQGNDLKVNTVDAVDGQFPEKKKSVASIASDSNCSDKPSNPKKAKLIRLERKKEKLAAKGLSLDDVQMKKKRNVEKSLEDFLGEEPKDGKHRLEVSLELL
jgi:arginyl-tRNA---protein transferase